MSLRSGLLTSTVLVGALVCGTAHATTYTSATGPETFAGTASADSFVFDNVADSPTGTGLGDTITSFNPAQSDKIDLSGLRLSGASAPNALHYAGVDPAGSGSTSVKAYGVWKWGDGSGTLRIDTNGDGGADMSIILANNPTISTSDFVFTTSIVGAQTLTGTAGNDTLTGGPSADILIGLAGVDTLTGGAGADTFRFSAVTDSPSSGDPDVIVDFSLQQGDRIDFTSLVASIGHTLTWAGCETPGPITKTWGVWGWCDGSGMIRVDTDGNGSSNIGITVLPGNTNLNATAFIGLTNTPSTTPVTGSIGSGADVVTVKISEDYYLGDAQYTVSVDGTQIGGTQTAKARHGSGTDTLQVRTSLTSATHQLTIDFLNDAYGGTTATDRNLYLEGADLNGTTFSAALTLLQPGPQTVSFVKGGGSPPTNDLPAHTTTVTESFNSGVGLFSNTWGTVGVSGGELTVTSHSGVWEDGGAMFPYSQTFGYGLFEFEVKANNKHPGCYALTWPADDQWPGPELDVFEQVDGGPSYSTIHYNNNGDDADTSYFMPDSIDSTAYHTYAMYWRSGAIDFFVDGTRFASTTSHIPADGAHGGLNTTPGVGEQTWWSVNSQSGDNTCKIREFRYSTTP